ncbi:MAG TPA: type I-C CRISPR-associated protein Cas8c/Csd1, partial [Anaerolineales bacterium]|nr:type I-C CRISPR-associated protein Cas8c/Csd1 [Anaerolineales bacterium]
MQKLYETYENSQSMIGAGADDNEIPLLPICHTTQKAQIEIVLDVDGNFRRARVIPKNEARTIIPCTESSAGRTSGESAHPLCDKLQYLAADYEKYGGEKDSYYQSYLDLLEKWVENGAPKKVQLIYEYVKRGRVIADLVAHGILFSDQRNKLFNQRPGEKDKNAGLDIFDLLPGKIDQKTGKLLSWQADAFVRWQVEIPNDPQSAVWNDPEIIQSWADYYSSTKEKKALCYVTGEESFSADQHPAKIRNDGDKAKIISSNDSQGYTFRGRFIKSDQAATVGFKTTQKAHSTLRWLIGRQGYQKNELAIVAWATSGAPVPQPTDGADSLLWGSAPTEEDSNAYTAQEIGIQLKKRIAGYGKKLGKTDEVVVMALDSATTGRMAITYYRDLAGSDYLKRIDEWHDSCVWRHTYFYIQEKDDKGKTKNRYIPFVGAPAPADIAEAAYASNRNGKFEVDEKLRKSTIARLLPCIVDGQPIPRDLVESAVRRASSRIALENWQWEKTLSIACALFKKFKTDKEDKKLKEEKENLDMSLDETRKTRDYLYGRLLAIADVLEERALFNAEKNRPTNAARYMQIFSQRPFRTWQQIHDLLTPYIMRLGGKAYFYKNLIAEVNGMFDP